MLKSGDVVLLDYGRGGSVYIGVVIDDVGVNSHFYRCQLWLPLSTRGCFSWELLPPELLTKIGSLQDFGFFDEEISFWNKEVRKVQ